MQNALNSKANSSDIPTKVSDLTNDSGFITNTVNNLTNYYTKTNTYTKSEVDSLISSVSSLDIQIVQTLPTQDISTSTIYLVPKTSSTNDNYDEYIYVNNSWEHIGSTEVDLSNYYTKTQTDNLLDDKADASSLSTVATTGSYNDLSNKPTIPTKTSDLTNDSGFVDNTYHDSTKQNSLVSGTNIKTINNESLLGSGNINITSGGGTMVDMRINGSSIVDSNNVGNIVTETAYNATTNKIATISDLTDKPFYDATYLLRAVGTSLTQEKFEELLDAVSSNTVIKIGNSMVFAIADLLPQIVISWINYDQFFMIKIRGEYNNHPVTYEYNGEKLTLAIDGDFIIQSIDSTITNEQYQTLVDGLFMEKCVIVEGAIGHISFKEKDNVIYLVISYLTDNVLNEILISDTTNNHQVTMEHKRLATTSDIPTKTSDLTNDSNYQNATQVQTAINNAIGTALGGSY